MIPMKYLFLSLSAPFIALSLSATELVTIISAVGALVVIVGGQIVNIITARAALAKIEQANAKIEQTLIATEVVKGHVNSEKTAAEGRENTLRRENELLRAALVDKAQVAAVLAAHVPTSSAATTAPAATQSLENIDANTVAIEKNTARTEATVQDLKDGTR